MQPGKGAIPEQARAKFLNRQISKEEHAAARPTHTKAQLRQKNAQIAAGLTVPLRSQRPNAKHKTQALTSCLANKKAGKTLNSAWRGRGAAGAGTSTVLAAMAQQQAAKRPKVDAGPSSALAAYGQTPSPPPQAPRYASMKQMWSVDRGDEIPELSSASPSRATGLDRAGTLQRVSSVPFAGLDGLASPLSGAARQLSLSKHRSQAEVALLGDLASEIATQGGPRAKLPLFAKSRRRHQVDRMHPVVEFDERGELVETWRWDSARPSAKPKEKFAFDRYFRNEKLNKYLTDLEAENQRYRIIKEKTKPQDLREDFRDFYRRIKTEHIKPAQAKQARQEASRARELAEQKASAARRYRSAQRPATDVICLSGGGLSEAGAEKDHFNTVPRQGEEGPAGGRRAQKFERAAQDSQRIFRACS